MLQYSSLVIAEVIGAIRHKKNAKGMEKTERKSKRDGNEMINKESLMIGIPFLGMLHIHRYTLDSFTWRSEGCTIVLLVVKGPERNR